MPATDPPDALTHAIAGLRYSLDRAPSGEQGRVVVRVGLAHGGDVPLVDRVDLFSFKARLAFAGLVADSFARQRSEVLGHLAVLLDAVERAQEPIPADEPPLSERRRAAAQALLGQPDLLDRAANAMSALGYVGEDLGKRLVFLVAVSRLLARPLSAILLAPSSSGKSELQGALCRLLPPSAFEFLSRITPSALYYAGPDHLRHRLVVVDEQAGASPSDYAIRTLQSKGLLRSAVPIRGRTEHFEARGPIALLSGTTSSTLNPENLSRCLQIPLDDTPEQTRRIHQAQRAAWAGQRAAALDLEPWQDAQRLLEPRRVVIPFAQRLTFPARTTHDRRGNEKLLGLVAAHALLFQHQRERSGSAVVAEPRDYAAVHALLEPALTRDLDGLSPRAVRLYRALAARRAGPLTRREAAALLDGSYNTAKRALGELLDQELVALADRGPPARYRLLDGSVLGAAGELLDPAALAGPG